MLLGLPPDDPSPAVDLAGKLLDYGVLTVIVTLGGQGALIVTGDGATRIPALAIEAADVTGAGDSFNAALAVFLGEGLLIEDAVRRAVVSGAYTAMRLGVIGGCLLARRMSDSRTESNSEYRVILNRSCDQTVRFHTCRIAPSTHRL